MEYFSRKLALQTETSESTSQPRLSHNEQSNRSSTGSLSSYLLKIKRENDLLKKNEEKMIEMFDGLQQESAFLSSRRETLEKSKRTCQNREKLLMIQQDNLQNQLHALLMRREEIASKRELLQAKRKELEEVKVDLQKKQDLIHNKRSQLYEREVEVKNMQSLLEDAKAEKFESILNHAVFHSKEASEIHELCSKLPSDQVRLSMICKPELDAIGTLKNRQAAIYAVDLAPSDPSFIQLQHLKKKIIKQKKANLHLFNQVKQLNAKVGRQQ